MRGTAGVGEGLRGAGGGGWVSQGVLGVGTGAGPAAAPRSAPCWPLPAAVAGAARAPSRGGEAEEARWRRRREPRAASAPRARPRAAASGGAEPPHRPHRRRQEPPPRLPAPPQPRAMPG